MMMIYWMSEFVGRTTDVTTRRLKLVDEGIHHSNESDGDDGDDDNDGDGGDCGDDDGGNGGEGGDDDDGYGGDGDHDEETHGVGESQRGGAMTWDSEYYATQDTDHGGRVEISQQRRHLDRFVD